MLSAELGAMVVFAKQNSSEVDSYVLNPMPIDLNCDEFERLLVAISHCLYLLRKRKDAIEDFLGEILDYVFKKAKVMPESTNVEDE